MVEPSSSKSGEAERLRLQAGHPAFEFVGNGTWFLLDQHWLGYPIFRLFETQQLAVAFRDRGTIHPDLTRINARSIQQIIEGELLELPATFPPWVWYAVVKAKGPLLKGHRYRETRSDFHPVIPQARRERILECVAKTPDKTGNIFGFRENWDCVVVQERYIDAEHPNVRLPCSQVGYTVNIEVEARGIELRYAGPPVRSRRSLK